MDTSELIPHLDFANHHPNATEADIKFILDQVTQHGFNAAFMNPSWVIRARHEWGYTCKIGTILSFPLGQDTMKVKSEAALEYARAGANELDAVCNISYIKEAKWEMLFDDMECVAEAIHSMYPGVIVKFIPECGYLTPDEIKKTAEVMVRAQVDFFKTCSGMGPRGANVEDVRLVKEAVGDQILIKCAGGIDTREEAEALLAAGAVRLGTSHALDIIGAPTNISAQSPALNE
jgi:deoxyribose-phosphate aldolase